MHAHNQLDGSAAALSAYCGLDEFQPPALLGHLQHDWDVAGPWPCPGEKLVSPRLPRLVWSERSRRRRIAAGTAPGIAIGAPWLYLLRAIASAEPSTQHDDAEKPEPKNVFLPDHGIMGRFAAGALAQLVADQKPLQVVLRAGDAAQPDIVAAYAAVGAEVVALPPRQPMDADDTVLRALAGLFTNALRFSSNTLSAEVLYAAAAGVDVGVYPLVPRPGVGATIPYASFDTVPRRLSPLLGAETGRGTVSRVVDDELGAASLLTPDQLRSLLDWRRRG